MRKTNFTLKRMKAALLSVASELTEPQKLMLRTHCECHVASMSTIARSGGYEGFRAANLQYAAVGRKIADRLAYDCPHGPMEAIATVADRKDKNGDSQWRLDDVVIQALKDIGWVINPTDVELSPYFQPADAIQKTDRDGYTKQRIGQDLFRRNVITLWGSCAVTGCSFSGVLIASHIVRWADCKTPERLDHFNGLLLTPNLDRLVDKGLVSFRDNGTLLFSKTISPKDRAALGVTDADRLRFVPPKILRYLRKHRELFLSRALVIVNGSSDE